MNRTDGKARGAGGWAKSAFAVVKQTFQGFSDDGCPSMAAALSYYTIFSLPPLLILLIYLVGFVVGDAQSVQGEIEAQVGELIGASAAEQVREMIRRAGERVSGGNLAGMVLSIGALLFGATGAFAQLQQALNTAWEVEPDPEQGGLKNFALKRLLSFGMILTIAFLLLVSLAVSAFIAVVGSKLQAFLPGGIGQAVGYVLELAVSFAVVTLLFAAVFKILPDAVIAWRDVWIGAVVTALLFVVGKFLIGLYLGQSNPGDAYGAAGSLAIILVWIYYSAMILLLGAEFTQVWAGRYGTRIRPDKGAVRVVEEKHHLRMG